VNTSRYSNMVTVQKAIYFCSCTREYIDIRDIPTECPVCSSGCTLSRIETYPAERTTENGQIVYPEVKDCDYGC
jgi:hypothetical protein